MQDIFPEMQRWIEAGKPFALATVTQTWGSAPRAVGAGMAVTAEMEVLGSVSGGCIEGEVIEAARTVLQSGVPQLLGFGVADETAWSVGLSCGGKVKVFVERHPAFSESPHSREAWNALATALAHNQPAILLTRLDPARHAHLLVIPDGKTFGAGEDFPEHALQIALGAYDARQSRQTEIDGEAVFVQVFPRRDRLIIIGAAHISIPLVKLAKDLEFEVITIDPRRVFATAERFAVPPDQMLHEWPQEVLPQLDLNEDTYVVTLTHDPKIDDPALHIFLKSPVAYIGALGSRRTHAKRVSRLKEAGFPEAEIARIHAPVGLDIGAATPAEIALSIMSQVIKIRRRPRVSPASS